MHFIISVAKFLTVFKNFVRKFLDEIAIDLRSMIKRSELRSAILEYAHICPAL